MKRIELLIMDVDGTLTDGKIYISNSGEEMKAFNVKDGYAIKRILPQLAIIPAIITGRDSTIVRVRAGELNISEVYLEIEDKVKAYDNLKKKYNIKDENIACIGDDFTDIPIIKLAGCTACPQDAQSAVKDACDYVMMNKGGDGAVSEFILILYKQINGLEFGVL